MKILKYRVFIPFWLIALLMLMAGDLSLAENIDPDGDGSQYAWGENVGWINFQPSRGPGVTVTDTTVTGYAWSENIGWINLDSATEGVSNDGVGNLAGYAWGENVGWINFAPADAGVTIDPNTGVFSGFAWGENIGWINFAANNVVVKTSWRSDTDQDGIPDGSDNCTLVPNSDQRDTNNDGYGNICDPDLNNDGITNFPDLALLKLVFFGNDDDADFNGDDVVNFLDLSIMRLMFFQPPGPSWIEE